MRRGVPKILEEPRKIAVKIAVPKKRLLELRMIKASRQFGEWFKGGRKAIQEALPEVRRRVAVRVYRRAPWERRVPIEFPTAEPGELIAEATGKAQAWNQSARMFASRTSQRAGTAATAVPRQISIPTIDFRALGARIRGVVRRPPRGPRLAPGAEKLIRDEMKGIRTTVEYGAAERVKAIRAITVEPVRPIVGRRVITLPRFRWPFRRAATVAEDFGRYTRDVTKHGITEKLDIVGPGGISEYKWKLIRGKAPGVKAIAAGQRITPGAPRLPEVPGIAVDPGPAAVSQQIGDALQRAHRHAAVGAAYSGSASEAGITQMYRGLAEPQLLQLDLKEGQAPQYTPHGAKESGIFCSIF